MTITDNPGSFEILQRGYEGRAEADIYQGYGRDKRRKAYPSSSGPREKRDVTHGPVT